MMQIVCNVATLCMTLFVVHWVGTIAWIASTDPFPPEMDGVFSCEIWNSTCQHQVGYPIEDQKKGGSCLCQTKEE